MGGLYLLKTDFYDFDLDYSKELKLLTIILRKLLYYLTEKRVPSVWGTNAIR